MSYSSVTRCYFVGKLANYSLYINSVPPEHLAYYFIQNRPSWKHYCWIKWTNSPKVRAVPGWVHLKSLIHGWSKLIYLLLYRTRTSIPTFTIWRAVLSYFRDINRHWKVQISESLHKYLHWFSLAELESKSGNQPRSPSGWEGPPTEPSPSDI